MKQLVKTCALSLIIAFMPIIADAQCAMCSATLERTESSVGAGLNQGIFYLMAIPYILIGAIAYFWYRSYKKKRMAESV